MLIGLSTHYGHSSAPPSTRGGRRAQRRAGVRHADQGRQAGHRARLRAVARAPHRAWFAIGGIDLDNVRDVVAAGALEDRRRRGAIRDAAIRAAPQPCAPRSRRGEVAEGQP